MTIRNIYGRTINLNGRTINEKGASKQMRMPFGEMAKSFILQ